MHLTLHLTERCNLRCRYCYETPGAADMPFETAIGAVRESAWQPNSGIIFFGGEPLLRRDLIRQIMDWCDAEWPNNFHYKITTNGMLLDAEFLRETRNRSLTIAMSFDGLPCAHDTFRVDASGAATAARLEGKLDLLLEHQPYAPIMMVVNPETVEAFAEGIEWLYAKGVRYLVCSLNHAADWDERDMARLKTEYKKLKKWYIQRYRAGEKIYFSPFDKAIASLVVKDYCSSCRFGLRQISVAANGGYYPCVQFVGDTAYQLGRVGQGIDADRQQELFEQNEALKPTCGDCALEARCHNRCACLNRQSTGDFEAPSPVLCAHERIVIPIADRAAEILYKERNGLFLHRYYNPAFPVISYLDDLAG